MRISALTFLIGLLPAALAIWPLPVSQSTGDDVLWIDANVPVYYNGASAGSGQAPSCSNPIVANAIERTIDTLFNKNIYPWKFYPRNSDWEPARPQSGSPYVRSIKLDQTKADPSNIMKPSIGDVDESYKLSLSSDGDVTITAASSIGLLYGLTTMTQLFYSHSCGGVYTNLAPAEIEDSPKFPWRGLNIDSSRTFKPMSDMYAMIDALSYNKMNRMHWHITDAQAWPLEIPSIPELTARGAYTPWQIYTPSDVQALQNYAALLGVEVVVEIDQPGHTSAIAFSHPELIAAFNVQPNWVDYCAEPPCGSLKLNDSAVPAFLEKLFDDLLPRLKPLTSYFHLGGDEVNLNTYTLDNTVGTNKSSVLIPLLQKFMDRNQKQLAAEGLQPLVWEEMLLDFNLSLPKNTIVQSWRENDYVAQVVKKGYQVIAGNYNFWYLDCGHGQWLDFHQSDSAAFWPYNDYCYPLHNWRDVYSYDPLEGVPKDLQHLVLGGETHTWSEQTDTINFHQIAWPRTSAAGEVLWSGAKDATGHNRSQITASPRLNEMRERLVARGIKADPIQMPFCYPRQDGPQCAWPEGA